MDIEFIAEFSIFTERALMGPLVLKETEEVKVTRRGICIPTKNLYLPTFLSLSIGVAG